jgi:hypothetical protein
MNVRTALGAGGHMPTLADQLLDVARYAKRAATFADGEYIPQMSRQSELLTALDDAGRAAAVLEDIGPRIAVLDGGEDGLRLARQALAQLGEGRSALRDGVFVDEQVLQGGAVVADAIGTGSASALFRDAESKVRGIADIARLESMSPDEAFGRLLAGR